MKRKLDEQEIELTKKGIKRIENEIKELQEQAEFNKLTIDFQNAQVIYQNAVRPFLRKKKEEEDKKVMDTINEQLARNCDTLKNLQDQIEKGVEIKNIKQIEEVEE